MKRQTGIKKFLPFIIVAVIAAGIGYIYNYRKILNAENIRKGLTMADAGSKVNDIYTAGYDLVNIIKGVINK